MKSKLKVKVNVRIVRNYPSTKTLEKPTLIVGYGLQPYQRGNLDSEKQKYNLDQIRGVTSLPQKYTWGTRTNDPHQPSSLSFALIIFYSAY